MLFVYLSHPVFLYYYNIKQHYTKQKQKKRDDIQGKQTPTGLPENQRIKQLASLLGSHYLEFLKFQKRRGACNSVPALQSLSFLFVCIGLT